MGYKRGRGEKKERSDSDDRGNDSYSLLFNNKIVLANVIQDKMKKIVLLLLIATMLFTACSIQAKSPEEGAVLFYSPYISAPDWDFSKLKRVNIKGISSNAFKFYRYK